jgi:preprotein translocase subunit SecF
MFDIIGKRRWFYLFSALITIPGLIGIALTFLPGGNSGLQFSIDYTGGTIWEVRFAGQQPSTAAVKEVLTAQGLPDSTVAITGAGEDQRVLIRTEEIGLAAAPSPTPSPSPAPSASASPSGSPGASPSGSASASPAGSGSPSPSASGSPAASPSGSPSSSPSTSASASASGSASPSPVASPSPAPTPPPAAGCSGVPSEGKLAELATALESTLGQEIACVTQESSIGPTISQELTGQALLLIVLGSAGVMGWITFRFGDFRMGATAIGALIHDVIVIVGTFALLGTFFGVQIDALFVTAMLTVIGFSVHDTIVVFDRIRENRIRHAGEPFDAIVNHSILQTIGRSLNTSLTIVLTLSALLLFGGDAIRVFVLALLLGIVSGTYSSIFNAAPILVDWHHYADRRRERQLLAAKATR